MLMAAERTRLGGPLRVLLVTTHVALRRVPVAEVVLGASSDVERVAGSSTLIQG